MPDWLSRRAPLWLGGALVVGAAVVVALWHARNGVMNGFQNESLHVGNALDFWGALQAGDGYHLSHYLETYPWPPGFYAWPWPLFSVFGAGHRMMVFSNLGHLALLLWGVWLLGRELGGRQVGLLSMLLVVAYPSVTGNLVRYEPNLATTAWVTLGVYCLVRCRGFADSRYSGLFGACLGVGLLMDRLTAGMFLGPLAVYVALRGVWQSDGRQWIRGVLRALVVCGVLAGWWYLGFVDHHLEELVEQVRVGEVDALGQLTEFRDPLALPTLLFYPATLLDSQAGLIPGLLALGALGFFLVAGDRRLRIPVLLVVASWMLFTLIQKKQVYYTIPALGCLACLSACLLHRLGRARRWVIPLVLTAGVHQLGLRMAGVGLPLPGASARILGEAWIPEKWVFPRFPQARQARGLEFPMDELAQHLPERGEVLVFSEEPNWAEGYLLLMLRERRPGERARGLLADPRGTYEWYRTAVAMVMVTRDASVTWPSSTLLSRNLEDNHYLLSELPPVVDAISGMQSDFTEQGSWKLAGGGAARVFTRISLLDR